MSRALQGFVRRVEPGRSVMPDCVPTAPVFGVATIFVESVAAIGAHENINAQTFAREIDRSDDLVDMRHVLISIAGSQLSAIAGRSILASACERGESRQPNFRDGFYGTASPA